MFHWVEVSVRQDLLEMEIVRPRSRPTESETLGVGPAVCVFIGFGDASAAQIKYENQFSTEGTDRTIAFTQLGRGGSWVSAYLLFFIF